MRTARTVLAGIAAASLWATVVAAQAGGPPRVQSLRAVLTADQIQQALQRSQQFAAAHNMVFSQ
jgi:hypothetical protein